MKMTKMYLLDRFYLLKVLLFLFSGCACFIVALPCYGQSASGSLTEKELLLSPEEIENQQKFLLKKWSSIRSWLTQTDLPADKRSRSQAALATAYLRGGSWPLAWEYASIIETPIWRAKVIMDVARAQFDNGNDALGEETLSQALSILGQRSGVADNENEALVYQTAATLMFEREQWEEIKDFLGTLQNPNHISAFSEALLPLIPEERQDISFLALNRLADFARSQKKTEEAARQLLSMADSAARSGHEAINGALLFEVTRLGLELPPSPKRDLLLFDISRNLLYADSYQLSNRIIRAINDPFIQARSLATAGRIIAGRKNFEAGLPLIQLGRDLLLGLVGQDKNIEETTRWVVVELTQVNQIEDAFRTSLRLRGQIAQSRSLTGMGLVLIDNEQYAQARQLLRFIPYANLKALIYDGLIREAGERNDQDEVDQLIRTAFESENFIPPLTGLNAENVSRILNHQLAYGDQRRNEAIFNLADDKLQREGRDSFARIDARIRLEKIFAKRGPLKSQEAAVRMESLLNSLWQFRGNPSYRDTLESIASFYLDLGDIEKAFTVAVSIPEKEPGLVGTEDDPIRFRRSALLKVAVVAARLGNIDYMLRAISLLENSTDQADTLTAAINVLSVVPDIDEKTG